MEFGKLFIGLVVLAIIVVIIVRQRNQISMIPDSLPSDSIILSQDSPLELSPNFKLAYTMDGNVCIDYKYKDAHSNFCQKIFNNSMKEKAFVLIDSKLTFNSFLGDPAGQFNTTGGYGFGIGYLAEETANNIVKTTGQQSDKQVIYDEIVNALRSKIPVKKMITPGPAVQ